MMAGPTAYRLIVGPDLEWGIDRDGWVTRQLRPDDHAKRLIGFAPAYDTRNVVVERGQFVADPSAAESLCPVFVDTELRLYTASERAAYVRVVESAGTATVAQSTAGTLLHDLIPAEENERLGNPTTARDVKFSVAVGVWRLPGRWQVTSRAPTPNSWWLQAVDEAAHDVIAAIRQAPDAAHPVVTACTSSFIQVRTRDLRVVHKLAA